MIKKLLQIIAGTVLVAALVFGVACMSLQGADAQSVKQAACEGSGGQWRSVPTPEDPQDGICTTPGQTRTVTSTLQQVGNILIFVVGAVSVLMVIIGGLRYTLAQGDQNATASAKNTILYAIIGIILSVAAYALVNFVIVGLNQ